MGFVIDTRRQNRLAGADTFWDKKGVTVVRYSSSGMAFGVHAVITSSDQGRVLANTRQNIWSR
jgi:hypothetical protein